MFAIITIIGLWQYELLMYGISQGMGQAKVILNTKPIEEILSNPTYPDSLKRKIKLVQEIRAFAFDTLGLNRNENYTTFYDQGNQPILWVLTACEPFRLKAKEWTFPLIGSFSYKGFFDIKKAKKEEELLVADTLDTSIDEVGGWSTLGWLKDPILSKMLYRSDGQLANLIIHELTHGTLYVKNNVDFNENLASFVGDKGALKFLSFKYGIKSPEYKNYEKSRISSKIYTKLVLDYSQKFDSLYRSFNENDSFENKSKRKKMMFFQFEKELQQFVDTFGRKNARKLKIEHLNNTYIMDVKRYKQGTDDFEKEFSTKFNSNFNLYISYLKAKYPSL